MLKLRPGQREVAEYRGGLLAVPAVPGAGKTTVLANLAADLIAEGQPSPGKILIVTVMNSAVANFRARIGDFLEQRGLSRNKGYEVKTLHALSMTILREKPEALLINNSFQVIDETRQNEIFQAVVYKWLQGNSDRSLLPFKLDSKKNKSWYGKCVEKWQQKDLPDLFRQAVSYLKGQGIGTDQAQELLRGSMPESYLAWALEVYLEYATTLRSQGLLDFDDLIMQALRLLQEDEGVLVRLQRRWTFIFEDEAQDSNPLQEQILHLLAGQRGNLVRVGDSNQAIMGTFTAAEPEIFRGFCKRVDVKRESILVSSRSSKQVIDLANYLISWAREEHPELLCREALEPQYINLVEPDDPFPNPRVEGYTLGIKPFTKREQEIWQIARLAALQAKKRPDHTLAILVPTKATQQEMADLLRQFDAEFEEVGKVTEAQVRTIIDVKVVVDYLAQPHKVNGLVQVLTQVLLRGIAQEAPLTELFKSYNLEEILYPLGGDLPWLNLPDELWDKELYAQFRQALVRLQSWLSASIRLAPEDLVLFLAEELHLVGEQLEIANNLALLVKQRVAENPHWKLIDIARDLPRIEASLRNFARVIYEQQGFTPRPGVITLLTTHKAKGLEWDTVYLPGVTASEYPSTLQDKFRGELWYLLEEMSNPMAFIKLQLQICPGNASTTNAVQGAKVAEISERLRLMYVAITRARKNLLISYHDQDRFNKKVGPSQIIEALGRFMREECGKYARA